MDGIVQHQTGPSFCGFLGAVPKLRKVIISFVIYLSVCPRGTARLPLMDINEIWYLSFFFFLISVEKIKVEPFGAGIIIIFLILAHTVYKMWIIQEPNKLALWNKLHFEEKKKRRV